MAVIRLLHKFTPKLLENYEELPLTLLAVLGLVGSTLIAAIVAIFFPIQWIFQGIFLIGMVIYTTMDRKWIITRLKKINKISFRLDFYLLILFSLITALILATSADIDHSYEDGLYHLQSILLITKHAMIPGIGLLHHHFAINSLWHISGALWGYQFLHPQQLIYPIVTPLLMMNFLLYLFNRYRTEKNRYIQWASLLLLIVGMFYLAYYRFDFGEVGNNLPSYILTWLIGLMFVQVFFRYKNQQEQSVESVLILIFTAFAWMVNLSTFMLIIPAVYLCYRLWKMDKKESLRIAGISLITLTPWIAKALITSGYFIYPPIARWFGIPFKWKMPYAIAKEHQLVAISSAKVPGVSVASVMDMTLREWVPQWFHLLDKYQIVLIAATIFVTVFTAFTLLIKRKELQKQNRMTAAIVLNIWMLASILFWFFTNPDPIFFYGSALLIIASIMISFSLWVSPRYRPNYPMLTRLNITTTILIIAFIFIRFNILSAINYTNIKILPAPFPQVETRQVEVNGFTINTPIEGEQCWGEAVPCVPDIYSESIYSMGDTIFDGLMFIENTP